LTQLTTLNIANNSLLDAGAQHLAALTQLTTLNIARNNLKDVGA
jgi:Leucine-rich repeat (LRR) protein